MDNTSFMSKYSFELMDQYLKDDSKIEEDQNNTPRSNTPIKLSLTKVMQRLSYRLQRDPKCIQDVQDAEILSLIVEKQERAEKFRRD